MKFDILKFMAYDIDSSDHGEDYTTETGGCVKCAMVESLGLSARRADSNRVEYDDVAGIILASREGGKMRPRPFEIFGGEAFQELMDNAERTLMRGEDSATVKKFVIDGMVAQGLIKQEEVANVK